MSGSSPWTSSDVVDAQVERAGQQVPAQPEQVPVPGVEACDGGQPGAPDLPGDGDARHRGAARCGCRGRGSRSPRSRAASIWTCSVGRGRRRSGGSISHTTSKSGVGVVMAVTVVDGTDGPGGREGTDPRACRPVQICRARRSSVVCAALQLRRWLDPDPAADRCTSSWRTSSRRRSTDGVYPPGHRIPSVRRLREQHGVSVTTAVEACRLLEARGLVRSRPTLGLLRRAAEPGRSPRPRHRRRRRCERAASTRPCR